MKQTRLTYQQIIELLISPRAALDRIIASGTIDYNDHGALQCCYVLAINTENESGIACPETKPMVDLCMAIDRGDAIDEDDIVACKSWLDSYAKYLRSVPISAFRKAIQITQEACRSA